MHVLKIIKKIIKLTEIPKKFNKTPLKNKMFFKGHNKMSKSAQNFTSNMFLKIKRLFSGMKGKKNCELNFTQLNFIKSNTTKK